MMSAYSSLRLPPPCRIPRLQDDRQPATQSAMTLVVKRLLRSLLSLPNLGFTYRQALRKMTNCLTSKNLAFWEGQDERQ